LKKGGVERKRARTDGSVGGMGGTSIIEQEHTGSRGHPWAGQGEPYSIQEKKRGTRAIARADEGGGKK